MTEEQTERVGQCRSTWPPDEAMEPLMRCGLLAYPPHEWHGDRPGGHVWHEDQPSTSFNATSR